MNASAALHALAGEVVSWQAPRLRAQAEAVARMEEEIEALRLTGAQLCGAVATAAVRAGVFEGAVTRASMRVDGS